MKIAAPFFLLALASPVLAKDIPTQRPASCKAAVTVQMLACRVDHIYQCADGTIWTDTFEANDRGPDYHLTLTTADGDMIWQGSGQDGVAATNATPAFSIARAMAEGAYSFSMPIEFHLSGAVSKSLSTGTVTPIPGTVTISGHEFHRFDVYQEAQFPPPGPLLTTHDVNYYDPGLGFVIFGEAKTTMGDVKHDYNWVPFAILNPADEGFLSPVPKYGCGELSLNLSDEKATHS